MGERWSIAWLRELATTPCACSPQPRAYELALVEAVEAAHSLATHMIEGADYPPDEAEFLWPLNEALDRFSFDAPPPTEGPV